MSLANDPYSFKLSLRGSTKLIPFFKLHFLNCTVTSVNICLFLIYILYLNRKYKYAIVGVVSIIHKENVIV